MPVPAGFRDVFAFAGAEKAVNETPQKYQAAVADCPSATVLVREPGGAREFVSTYTSDLRLFAASSKVAGK